MKTILEKLNKLVVKTKLTKEQFADLSGIKRQTLYNYLNGDTKMSVEALIKICKALKVTVGSVVDPVVISTENDEPIYSESDQTKAELEKIIDRQQRMLEHYEALVIEQRRIIDYKNK